MEDFDIAPPFFGSELDPNLPLGSSKPETANTLSAVPSPQAFRRSTVTLDMAYVGNRATFDVAGLDKVSIKVVSVDNAGYPAGGVLTPEDTIDGENWDALTGAVNVTATGTTQSQPGLTCQGKQLVSLRVSTAASGSRVMVSFTGYKTT